MEPKNNNVGVTHVSDLAAHYWQVTFHREERSQVVLARFWLYLHACMCSLKCSLKCSLNSYSVPICKIQNFRIEFHSVHELNRTKQCVMFASECHTIQRTSIYCLYIYVYKYGHLYLYANIGYSFH